jgi:hypothetical protein
MQKMQIQPVASHLKQKLIKKKPQSFYALRNSFILGNL